MPSKPWGAELFQVPIFGLFIIGFFFTHRRRRRRRTEKNRFRYQMWEKSCLDFFFLKKKRKMARSKTLWLLGFGGRRGGGTWNGCDDDDDFSVWESFSSTLTCVVSPLPEKWSFLPPDTLSCVYLCAVLPEESCHKRRLDHRFCTKLPSCIGFKLYSILAISAQKVPQIKLIFLLSFVYVADEGTRQRRFVASIWGRGGGRRREMEEEEEEEEEKHCGIFLRVLGKRSKK